MNEYEFRHAMYHLGTLFNSNRISAKEYNKRAAELREDLMVVASCANANSTERTYMITVKSVK
jgi:hypothetical protein